MNHITKSKNNEINYNNNNLIESKSTLNFNKNNPINKIKKFHKKKISTDFDNLEEFCNREPENE